MYTKQRAKDNVAEENAFPLWDVFVSDAIVNSI